MVGQHAFRWAPAHHSIFEISSNRHVIAQLAPWQMHNLKAQRSGPRAIRLDQQRRRAGLAVTRSHVRPSRAQANEQRPRREQKGILTCGSQRQGQQTTLT